MRRRASILVSAGLLLGLVGCDHATKRTAEVTLKDRSPVTLVSGVADLRYAENRGVAFNLERMLPGVGRPLLFAAGAALVLVLIVAWVRRASQLSAVSIGYAFILAGALGNLIDRVARGYVIDFIHIHHWPVFNVADVLIGVGVGLVLLASFRARRERGPAAPA